MQRPVVECVGKGLVRPSRHALTLSVHAGVCLRTQSHQHLHRRCRGAAHCRSSGPEHDTDLARVRVAWRVALRHAAVYVYWQLPHSHAELAGCQPQKQRYRRCRGATHRCSCGQEHDSASPQVSAACGVSVCQRHVVWQLRHSSHELTARTLWCVHSVANNRIDGVGARSIAAAVSRNTTLTHLECVCVARFCRCRCTRCSNTYVAPGYATHAVSATLALTVLRWTASRLLYSSTTASGGVFASGSRAEIAF